uniref:BTB domain-containing protein n=1 Tax=Panagrolaimus davidi TaxID=227884 RepID=A0A914PH38_9BILA
MFENDWKEAIEGIVAIPDFPFKTVKTAIELCYGSLLHSDTNIEEIILLFHFADKYDIEELKDTIKEVILITPNNICEYANLFCEENCAELVNICIDRLIVYFQYSYSVKDLDSLNNDIKLQFFSQASTSESLKKDFPFDFYKNKNDENLIDAYATISLMNL